MKTCPMCGSKKIKLVTGPYGLPGGGKLRKVTREVCPDCKEQFFDGPTTSRLLKAAKRRKRKIKSRPATSVKDFFAKMHDGTPAPPAEEIQKWIEASRRQRRKKKMRVA